MRRVIKFVLSATIALIFLGPASAAKQETKAVQEEGRQEVQSITPEVKRYGIGQQTRRVSNPKANIFGVADHKNDPPETFEDRIIEPGDPYRTHWRFHGVLMGVAWIFCVPVAIATSLARSFIGKHWFKIHASLMVCCAVFTLIGFSIAVAATNASGKPRYGGSHQKVGLAMFILAWFQFWPALFKRPKKPKQTAADVEAGAVEEKKSEIRIAWEIGHRILGLILLVLGMYNTNTGPKLFAAMAGLSYDNYLKAWWTWHIVLFYAAMVVWWWNRYVVKKKIAAVPNDTQDQDSPEIYEGEESHHYGGGRGEDAEGYGGGFAEEDEPYNDGFAHGGYGY